MCIKFAKRVKFFLWRRRKEKQGSVSLQLLVFTCNTHVKRLSAQPRAFTADLSKPAREPPAGARPLNHPLQHFSLIALLAAAADLKSQHYRKVASSVSESQRPPNPLLKRGGAWLKRRAGAASGAPNAAAARIVSALPQRISRVLSAPTHSRRAARPWISGCRERRVLGSRSIRALRAPGEQGKSEKKNTAEALFLVKYV